jgi:hypothetical protein
MTFQLAHANRNSTSHNERLRVYASRNCGETWTLRYTKSGDNLNTAGGFVSSTFIPDANEWREETVSLTTMAGEGHVLIKFEAFSDKQSYLYLDDINITPNASVGINDNELVQSVSIYPNPITNESLIKLGMAENSDASIELVNVMGQVLGAKKYNLTAGSNNIAVSEIARINDSGFYLILLKTESGTKTLKLVKNN